MEWKLNMNSNNDSITFPNISIALLVLFDIGELDNIDFDEWDLTPSIRDIADGAYHVGLDRIVFFHGKETLILKRYSDHFRTRIKSEFRRLRRSLMIEMFDIHINGLLHEGDVILPRNQILRIKPVISIHKLGVGCITIWVNLEKSFNTSTLMKLRNFQELMTNVHLPFAGFNGDILISDLMRLLIIFILKQLYVNRREVSSINMGRRISQDPDIKSFHQNVCKLISGDMPVLSELDFYPALFMDIDLNNKDMRAWVENHASHIRAIITGDLNWDKKKESIVKSLVPDADQSTRDSIIWISDTYGTIKFLSSEMETDRLTSRVLSTFELEILLTLRFLLKKINFNLSANSNTKLSLKTIMDLRDNTISSLEDYYNMNISSKETTIKRIEAGKSVININYLYDVTMLKFETLGSKLDTFYQDEIIRRQNLLALIFGIFGVAEVVFNLSAYYYGGCRFQLVLVHTLLALILTLLIGYYLFIKRRR